jgi:hypothetical protein
MKLKSSVCVGALAALGALGSAQAAVLVDTMTAQQTTWWTQSSVDSMSATLVTVKSRASWKSIEWAGQHGAKAHKVFQLCVYKDEGSGPGTLMIQKTLMPTVTAVKRVTYAASYYNDQYLAKLNLGAALPAGKYWVSISGDTDFIWGVSTTSGVVAGKNDGALGSWMPGNGTTPTDFYARGQAQNLKLSGQPVSGGATLAPYTGNPGACASVKPAP